jgi:amino acid adenylation domain-containing protein
VSIAPRFLDERLEASAREHGARTALVAHDGSVASYAELEATSVAVAAWLAARGIGRGDRVALLLPKDSIAVAVIFGVLRAGAAYVPLDPASPPARARAILADAAIAAVIARPDLAPLAVGAVPADAPILTAPGAAWNDLRTGEPDAPSRRGRKAGDLAYVLYVSGASGVPKGVTMSHASAGAFADWAAAEYAVGPSDRASSHAPFHLDLSVLDLFAPLGAGAELHLIDDALARSPRALGEVLERSALTLWHSAASALALLAAFGGLGGRELGGLRCVLSAGEAFPPPQLARLGALLPDAAIHNLYGPTETNVCTAAPVPRPLDPDRGAPIPIGAPCAGYRALVLDGPGGAPVAQGAEGLLHVAGPALFQGYWNAPAQTAARIFERREPGGSKLRWYDTGDVVRETGDGYVFVGRRDRMVKRRGHRIELAEVEHALRGHPRLRAAAVVALPDPDMGVLLRAHLVTVDGAPLSILELKTYCASLLPAPMVPDRFAFETELPQTPSDAVDYARLETEA